MTMIMMITNLRVKRVITSKGMITNYDYDDN